MNKTVIMTGSPFFDESGEILFVITIIRDVTEFIKLREKLEALENDKLSASAGQASQRSPIPSVSRSSWPGLAVDGQLSASAHRPSASTSSRGSTGQRSQTSPTPSPSASA